MCFIIPGITLKLKWSQRSEAASLPDFATNFAGTEDPDAEANWIYLKKRTKRAADIKNLNCEQTKQITLRLL